MIRLTLYGRPGCHLCDDMLAALAPHQASLGFALDEVDVDTDPALAARYGVLIPVLAWGSREICHYRLDAEALLKTLRNPGEDG
ncbi:MAG: glutaredoxin family protein [Pseudomonadota bacterium]